MVKNKYFRLLMLLCVFTCVVLPATKEQYIKLFNAFKSAEQAFNAAPSATTFKAKKNAFDAFATMFKDDFKKNLNRFFDSLVAPALQFTNGKAIEEFVNKTDKEIEAEASKFPAPSREQSSAQTPAARPATSTTRYPASSLSTPGGAMPTAATRPSSSISTPAREIPRPEFSAERADVPRATAYPASSLSTPGGMMPPAERRPVAQAAPISRALPASSISTPQVIAAGGGASRAAIRLTSDLPSMRMLSYSSLDEYKRAIGNWLKIVEQNIATIHAPTSSQRAKELSIEGGWEALKKAIALAQQMMQHEEFAATEESSIVAELNDVYGRFKIGARPIVSLDSVSANADSALADIQYQIETRIFNLRPSAAARPVQQPVAPQAATSPILRAEYQVQPTRDSINTMLAIVINQSAFHNWQLITRLLRDGKTAFETLLNNEVAAGQGQWVPPHIAASSRLLEVAQQWPQEARQAFERFVQVRNPRYSMSESRAAATPAPAVVRAPAVEATRNGIEAMLANVLHNAANRNWERVKQLLEEGKVAYQQLLNAEAAQGMLGRWMPQDIQSPMSLLNFSAMNWPTDVQQAYANFVRVRIPNFELSPGRLMMNMESESSSISAAGGRAAEVVDRPAGSISQPVSPYIADLRRMTDEALRLNPALSDEAYRKLIEQFASNLKLLVGAINDIATLRGDVRITNETVLKEYLYGWIGALKVDMATSRRDDLERLLIDLLGKVSEEGHQLLISILDRISFFSPAYTMIQNLITKVQQQSALLQQAEAKKLITRLDGEINKAAKDAATYQKILQELNAAIEKQIRAIEQTRGNNVKIPENLLADVIKLFELAKRAAVKALQELQETKSTEAERKKLEQNFDVLAKQIENRQTEVVFNPLYRTPETLITGEGRKLIGELSKLRQEIFKESNLLKLQEEKRGGEEEKVNDQERNRRLQITDDVEEALRETYNAIGKGKEFFTNQPFAELLKKNKNRLPLVVVVEADDAGQEVYYFFDVPEFMQHFRGQTINPITGKSLSKVFGVLITKDGKRPEQLKLAGEFSRDDIIQNMNRGIPLETLIKIAGNFDIKSDEPLTRLSWNELSGDMVAIPAEDTFNYFDANYLANSWNVQFGYGSNVRGKNPVNNQEIDKIYIFQRDNADPKFPFKFREIKSMVKPAEPFAGQRDPIDQFISAYGS